MEENNNTCTVEYFCTVERAWFLVNIQTGLDLSQILKGAWDVVNDDENAPDEATFLVRADTVEGEAEYNVIVPATASSAETMADLQARFEEALQAQLGDGDTFVIHRVTVVEHYPSPPQNGAPSYIAFSEMNSPVGKRKDNPWG